MKIGIQPHTFGDWLKTATDCCNVVFQAIDLTPFDDELAALPQAEDAQDGCVFLGCTLGPKMSAVAIQHHGVVFPNLSGRPYKPFHASLYTAEELFAGFDSAAPETYRQTPDWLTYTSFIKVDENSQPMHPIQYVKVGADEMLARRLHDHFISEALGEMLAVFDPKNGGKGVVAVMGGHDRKRSDPVFSQVTKIARQLTIEGFLVASGGGPGLMEAANLGAFFARRSETELESAIARMADPAAEADKYSDPNWLKVAWEVRRDFKPEDVQRCRSLGVPTWFYGHEPPNVFASDIAKYFENSLREEGLLGIATHGVIFAQGNAGTAQEIFQDACQNYYDSYGYKSPMILLGVAAWNPRPDEMSDDKNSSFYGNKPAWPLLSKLARMKKFSNLLTLTDDPEEVLTAIRCFRAPGQAQL